jgi:heat shock protein HslJ
VAQGRLMFDPGDQGTSRLSGTAGCNRFSGNWKQDGATLQLGPMAATRMACPPPAMEIEQRVVALLEAANSVTYTADGAAILATPDGRKLILRKAAQP